MKKNILKYLWILSVFIVACSTKETSNKTSENKNEPVSVAVQDTIEPIDEEEVLISFMDEDEWEYGYKNLKGDTIIPLGKYTVCFTDTFKTYAIVIHPENGMVAINKKEEIMYNVFVYDNGPDYISDGLFRIVKNDKIGYADSQRGQIVIEPQYKCAWEFENGKAQVANDCNIHKDGEYSIWKSDNWFFIDIKGNKVN